MKQFKSIQSTEKMMDTTRSFLIIFIIISSTLYQNADSDEISELLKEKCEEAEIAESLATCDPEKGRIYVYDPEIRGFDEARRWCRLKLGGRQEADLLSIETCDEWSKISDIVKPFIKSNGSLDWIWTQIIYGPRIVDNNSLPQVIMEKLSGDALSPSLSDLQLNCLKTVIESDVTSTNDANTLVLFVNELSITPKLVPRSSDGKGHALCEYRFTPGIIDIPIKPTEPNTEAPTTELPITEKPEPITERPFDWNETTIRPVDELKDVDDFFIQIGKNITQESSQDVASTILSNIRDEDFILTTPEHIEKTVDLAQKLDRKVDEELSKIRNKSVAIAERVTFTQQICSILSTLMDNKNVECWSKTEINQTPVYATQIITETEEIGLKLACQLTETSAIPIDADTIQMEVFAFDNRTYLDQELAFPSKQSTSSQSAQIKFPSGVNIETVKLASTCGRPSGLGTIIKKISTYMDPPEEKVNIISDLVSFSFGEKVTDVNVQVSLSHNEVRRRGDLIKCVFWDPINTVWNSTGCVYDEIASTRRKTVCHCSHLTNFAILMDVSGRQEDNQIKSIFSLICLTASVIGLILTIFFLIILPPVKSTPITNKRVTITTNLCICLLIADFILMFGVEHTENIIWCRALSATLFYCLAATFTWMMLEGYLLYQMIVVVPLNFEFRSRWLYLIGYGFALIWLGVTVSVLGIESFYDDTSYYCWISNPLYPSRIWFFAGPVALIILANMIIYGKSIQIALMSNIKRKNWAARGARPDQKTGQDSGLVRRWLKGSCSLLILLGLTWAIGFLYFNEWSDWLSYVFILINGSQGVFIFMFEIATNSKARPAIIRMVSGKFPSTYISSFSKTSSSNPISSLSTRSSKLFNQQSLHGKESSKGTSTTSPTSPTSLNERRKIPDSKSVIMELKGSKYFEQSN